MHAWRFGFSLAQAVSSSCVRSYTSRYVQSMCVVRGHSDFHSIPLDVSLLYIFTLLFRNCCNILSECTVNSKEHETRRKAVVRCDGSATQRPELATMSCTVSIV